MVSDLFVNNLCKPTNLERHAYPSYPTVANVETNTICAFQIDY